MYTWLEGDWDIPYAARILDPRAEAQYNESHKKAVRLSIFGFVLYTAAAIITCVLTYNSNAFVVVLLAAILGGSIPMISALGYSWHCEDKFKHKGQLVSIPLRAGVLWYELLSERSVPSEWLEHNLRQEQFDCFAHISQSLKKWKLEDNIPQPVFQQVASSLRELADKLAAAYTQQYADVNREIQDYPGHS